MPANILKGKPVADALCEEMKKDIEQLKERGINPTLAILRVGEREDDLSYERGAMKRCESVGVAVKNVVLPADVPADSFYETLEALNTDENVHGILMFRPLPKHIDGEKARKMLLPEKDVDGCTDGSLAGVFTGTKIGFTPCTAQAAMEILHYYNIEISGKKAAVIGRSLVIGRPVAMLLMHENATATICHTRTKDVPSITREADIIIAASGQMESVGAEYVSEGQCIIDVGIGWNEEKGKLCGDVRTDEVAEIAHAVTPVPGGVGSVTTCILVKHVVEAAARLAEAGCRCDSNEAANCGISVNSDALVKCTKESGGDKMDASMLGASVEEFTRLLASKTSVPGGGGASALVGAIGIALGDMVGEFTVGKKKYADVEGDIIELMDRAQKLRIKLLECIDEDAKAFEPLSKAYGIPKEEPGRDEILEKCLKDAAEVPMKIMKLSCEAVEILKGFYEKGSRIVVSDAVTGAGICAAAIKGAAVNVRVNTKLMKDREYAESIDKAVDEMLSSYIPMADAMVM
ncbi:MAG: cyclodeaminase/cyclohydrolase family protein [Lachnospiraceae bacterium]|nr:cyclodeaminase/cyclohydrolase family protein [Candidatus Merdinaster equi]